MRAVIFAVAVSIAGGFLVVQGVNQLTSAGLEVDKIAVGGATMGVNGTITTTGAINTAGGVILNTAGAATGLIVQSGNVGIGTTNPTDTLEVVGDIVSKGTKWTIRTSAADNGWRDVTYGNGLFVAVAASGVGNRVMTSPDGINWTSRTSAADNDWLGVTYGNGLFVAVATSGLDNRVMTSPDGINWTS